MASVKVDGPSSSGKNFAVDAAVAYIPDGRVIRITGMSQKALVYGDEPLERKFLYFPEGAGIRDDSDAAIYLRSLLSEGEIRYEVTVYAQPGASTRRRRRSCGLARLRRSSRPALFASTAISTTGCCASRSTTARS